jgi:hypothetical protein
MKLLAIFWGITELFSLINIRTLGKSVIYIQSSYRFKIKAGRELIQNAKLWMLSIHEPIILALSTERTKALMFPCFVEQEYNVGLQRNTLIFEMRVCDFTCTDLHLLQEQMTYYCKSNHATESHHVEP